MAIKKKFLNGWYAPRFMLTDLNNNLQTKIDMSLRYQGLTEWHEDNFIQHDLLSGASVQEFQFLHLYWDLDYSAFMDAEDGLKMQDVLNAFYSGHYKIELMPHRDHPERYKEIILMPDKRGLSNNYGGNNAMSNKDFKVSFRTKAPLNLLNWLDASNFPVIGFIYYENCSIL